MLKNQIKLYDELSVFFDTKLRKSLKGELKEIKKVFVALIEQYAKDYNLTSENSVHDSIYANVVGRVKNKKSFKEKLIRKNLGLEFINKHKLVDEIEGKKGELELSIKHDIDDIIGLRIVCDLRKDCIKVFELLKDKEKDLNKKGIVFELGEMDNQPQTMKNGLDIYRIKGIYDSRIAFELQIKSKIEEAWGELDHFMLYKDFSFFPSKDIVQKTMNNVGKLLDEIEFLLYDLRNSKNDYKDNLEDTDFLDALEITVNDSIKENFSFSYQLEKIAGVLKLISDDLETKVFDKKPKKLDFEFLKFNSNIHSDYLSSRNSSYELQILESIFVLIWSDKNHPLDENSYDSFLTELKKYLNRYMKEVLTKKELIHSYGIDEIEELRKFLIESEPNAQIWISPKKVSELIKQRKILSDAMYSINENEDGLFDNGNGELEELVEELNKLNALQLFESKKLKEAVENLSVEIPILQTALIKLNEYSEEYSLSNFNKEDVINFKRSFSQLNKIFLKWE